LPGREAARNDHLTHEHHLTIVRALWEQRPTRLFARVECPALLVPAEPPPPLDEQVAQWLDRKRRSVALAEATIPHARVVWARESIHDVQLHRPAWLAEQIAAFAKSRTEG